MHLHFYLEKEDKSLLHEKKKSFLFWTILGAFKLYDVDNDGYITREEMYNVSAYILAQFCTLFGWPLNLKIRLKKPSKLEAHSFFFYLKALVKINYNLRLITI